MVNYDYIIITYEIVIVEMSTSMAGEISTGNKRTKCIRKWGSTEDAKLVKSLVSW